MNLYHPINYIFPYTRCEISSGPWTEGWSSEILKCWNVNSIRHSAKLIIKSHQGNIDISILLGRYVICMKAMRHIMCTGCAKVHTTLIPLIEVNIYWEINTEEFEDEIISLWKKTALNHYASISWSTLKRKLTFKKFYNNAYFCRKSRYLLYEEILQLWFELSTSK